MHFVDVFFLFIEFWVLTVDIPTPLRGVGKVSNVKLTF